MVHADSSRPISPLRFAYDTCVRLWFIGLMGPRQQPGSYRGGDYDDEVMMMMMMMMAMMMMMMKCQFRCMVEETGAPGGNH